VEIPHKLRWFEVFCKECLARQTYILLACRLIPHGSGNSRVGIYMKNSFFFCVIKPKEHYRKISLAAGVVQTLAFSRWMPSRISDQSLCHPELAEAELRRPGKMRPGTCDRQLFTTYCCHGCSWVEAYRRLIVYRSTRLDDLFIALALVSIHVLNVSKHPPNQLPVSSYQIDHCSMSKY